VVTYVKLGLIAGTLRDRRHYQWSAVAVPGRNLVMIRSFFLPGAGVLRLHFKNKTTKCPRLSGVHEECRQGVTSRAVPERLNA